MLLLALLPSHSHPRQRRSSTSRIFIIVRQACLVRFSQSYTYCKQPKQRSARIFYSVLSTLTSRFTNASMYHELPKLNVPSIGDTELEWKSILDSFSNTVHDNISMMCKSQSCDEKRSRTQFTHKHNTCWKADLVSCIKLSRRICKVLPNRTSDVTEMKTFYDGMGTILEAFRTWVKHMIYGSLLVPIILNKILKTTIKETWYSWC